MGYKIQAMPGRGQRIPETLQQVFLASNRGKDVHKPPPGHTASRTFFNWFRPKNNKNNNNNSTNKKLENRRSNNNRSIRRHTLHTYSSTGSVSSIDSDGSSQSPGTPRRRVKRHNSSDNNTPLRASAPAIRNSPKKKKKQPETNGILQMSMSPQGYLDSLLRQRGYSTQKYRTLDSSYYNKPTPLQLSSYHSNLVSLVRDKDEKKVRDLVSCGLSPNPCNQHGESVIHGICRRNDYRILQAMISMGASVQVSDDQGRTPLHEACWGATNCFATVDVVLQQDPRLIHMMDARGATPLSFVRSEDWPSWIKFLRSRLDLYWPLREEEEPQGPPARTLEEPNSCPLPDPEDALTPELAAMVVAGRITPQEAEFLMEDDGQDDTTVADDDTTFYDSSVAGDEDDSLWSDDSDFDDFDEFSVFGMESVGFESVVLDAVPEEQTEHTETAEDKPGVPRKDAQCPEAEPISSVYSSEASQGNDDDDHDSDAEDMFDEADIENLIQGITAGKEISWSA